VSGNDVPIGSLKEEVRDDIPAMLSEGEFVFPADVTRYYGLDTLMKMRQKAKQGLKVMEAMGQMGNSEDATIPDDIPFDMDDLELAEGGVVTAQQGMYVPPNLQGVDTTGVGQAPTLAPTSPLPNVGGYTPPPIADPTPKSFTDLMGSAGYDELRTYINDQGQQMQIPFKDGKPLSAIPEGFKPRDAGADTTVRPTFTTATDMTNVDSGSDTVRPAITAEEKVNEEKLLRDSAQRDLAPRGARAFEKKDFQDYLKVRSPSGSDRDTAPPMGRMDGTTTPSPFIGKAGDFVDKGVGMVLPGALTRQSDRAIRREAARKLDKGLYVDETEYKVLRDVVNLEPTKPPLGSLFTDTEDDTKLIESVKGGKYDPVKAAAHKAKKQEFDNNLKEERANNPFSRTNTPNQDFAIISNDLDVQRQGGYANMSGIEIEEQQRKNEDRMRRAAASDAQMERENKRRAEARMNNDNDSSNDTGGSDFSEPTAGGDATHCCTASYKRKGMTISQVKELRRWHRKQSQIWQDGYDVWGKYIADRLVAKSDWSASVVKSVHDLIIKKKLTLKGLYGIMVISSGVYPIGLFKRIIKHGRIFQST
jgi:hypothetical protein